MTALAGLSEVRMYEVFCVSFTVAKGGRIVELVLCTNRWVRIYIIVRRAGP